MSHSTIQATLEPTQLVVNQTNEIAIRLTNASRGPCTNVVFKLTLPAHIVLLQGPDRVERARLDAGQWLTHTMRVRPKQVGKWTLTSANFSYRDALGQSHRISDLRLEVVVVPVAAATVNPDVELARAHERAGEWRKAWPLFRRANLVESARVCFQRALEEYERERLDREAGQQCEAWADLEIELVGRRVLGDRTTAEWFERAAHHYVLAEDSESAARCREKAAQIMQTARFHLQVTAPPDARFVEGKSTLIAVRLKNIGYGPAREVRVRVSGDVETTAEHVFSELQIGQVVQWNTARVVPIHAGTALLRVDVDYKSYRSEQVGHADIEQPIAVDEGRLLSGISRGIPGGATVQLNIEKYLAPGSISNEMDVHDSVVISHAPLFTDTATGNPLRTAGVIKDSVVVNNLPSGSVADASKPEGYCPNCGKPHSPRINRCPQCGIRLCSQCGRVLTEDERACHFCSAEQ